jgi:hypothetical protein
VVLYFAAGVLLLLVVVPPAGRGGVVPECFEPPGPSTTVQVPPEPWATTMDVKSAEAGLPAVPPPF